MTSYDPTMAPPQSFRQALVFIAFHGVFLFIGLFLVVFPLWFLLWEQWRWNNVFLETEGLVLAKRVHPTGEGGLSPQVRVRYRAGDQEMEGWSLQTPYFILREDGRPPALYEAIQIGEKRSVWFDPSRPSHFVLERTYGLHWVAYPILAVGLFFTLYAGGTILRGLRSWKKGVLPGPSETQ